MRNYFAIFRKIIIFASWYSAICWICSHTLRGCVDWNSFFVSAISREKAVTPFVGVWIETLPPCSVPSGASVTPFVGVWIETLKSMFAERPAEVTPFVGVWIETLIQTARQRQPSVTPFVGVWIETGCASVFRSCCRRHTLRGCVDWNAAGAFITKALGWSHPSWVCGLKHIIYIDDIGTEESHPSWVCGLKLKGCKQ